MKDKLIIDNEIIFLCGLFVECIFGLLEYEDIVELVDFDEYLEENMENYCENEYNNNWDDNVFGFENYYYFFMLDIYEVELRNLS